MILMPTDTITPWLWRIMLAAMIAAATVGGRVALARWVIGLQLNGAMTNRIVVSAQLGPHSFCFKPQRRTCFSNRHLGVL
jgi:hypothetical protein